MTGAPCPSCGREVMAFGTFFVKAEPYKTFACQHCSAVVARAPSVWLVILAMGLVAGVAGLVVARLGFTAWQAMAILVPVVAAGVVATKLIAYRWVGWRLVTRP